MSSLNSGPAGVGAEQDLIVGKAGNLSNGWQADTQEATETTRLLGVAGQEITNGGRKDSWVGADDFAGLPWWRAPSVYWLLGPYFLFTLAFGGILVPKLNLIVDLVCREYFADQTLVDPNFTFLPVILGADNPQCFIPDVKKNVSIFTLVLGLVTGILSSIIAPKFGHLSDRYGRKKLLAVASCGGLLAELITILCAKYPDVVHYNWMIFGSMLDGLTGSFTTGSILTNSYCSDCTPPSKRAVSIGYLHACLFTGLAFGPLLAGYFVTWTGSLLSIFYVTSCCHLFFILFVGFVIPESLSKKRQQRAREKHAQEQDGQDTNWAAALRRENPLAPLKILYPTGAGTSAKLRLNFIALSVVDMILLGSAMSAGTVILLYSESDTTWNWGTLESSRFISAVSMVRVLALVLIMPTINYFGRIRPAARRRRESGIMIMESNEGADKVDVWVLRFGLVSDVVGSLGYLFARTESIFILSGMVTAFGGLGSATIQAALTKHVPPERTGQLLGAIGLLHSLSRVLSPIAFNTVYYATVGKFDQAIFVLLSSMFGVALLASLLVSPHVYMKDSDDPAPLSPTNLRSAAASSESLLEDELAPRV